MEPPMYLSRPAHASAVPMERTKVGEVFHFFGQISVAAIRLTDGSLAIGDTVQIQGPTTNLQQTVDTLQIEHAKVDRADRGQEVGMKVRDRVREKDFVYKVLEPGTPAQPTAPPKRAEAARKAATVKRRPRTKRKAPSKRKAASKPKAPSKRKGPIRKRASRAKRSTKRRGSRKSRSRSR